MAGTYKPNNAGEEGIIDFITYSSYNGSLLGIPTCDGLIDGIPNTNAFGGAIILNNYYQKDYITFTIYNICNIWAINGFGSDGGGCQGNPINLYKLLENGSKGELIYTSKENRSVDIWYVLIPSLQAGSYYLENALGYPGREGGYCIWKEWFIENCSKKLYSIVDTSNETVYGMNNNVFTKLTDKWSTLNDDEKVSLFDSTNSKTATIEDLSKIGKFKILSFAKVDTLQSVTLTIVPKDQLIKPKGLISIESFEGIDKASLTVDISGSGSLKMLVTNDNKTYQTYDFTNKVWQVIDHTDLNNVKIIGIEATMLTTIDRTAWDALTTGKAGIGFAYLLCIEDTADTCAVDKLDMQVDMKGSWDKAIQGTDYKYGYPRNNILRVQLLANGDYKINYQK